MAAAEFPNTQAWSRLPDIFAAIKAAGTPPKFNNEFLKSTLGFTSSNDRSVIAILRKLGFIGSSGEPTQRCNNFKGHEGGRGESASRSCVLEPFTTGRNIGLTGDNGDRSPIRSVEHRERSCLDGLLNIHSKGYRGNVF